MKSFRPAWSLLLLVVGTGLLVFCLPGHWSTTTSLLRLHYWLGWLLLVAAGPALAAHLVRTRSRTRWALTAGAAILLAGLAAPHAVGGFHPPDGVEPSEYFYSLWVDWRAGFAVPRVFWLPPLATTVLLLGCAAASVWAVAARPAGLRASRASGAALVLLTAWALVSGAGLEIAARDNLFLAITNHTAAGIAATALVAVHVLATRMGKAGATRARSATVAALLLLGTAAGAYGLHRVEHVRARISRVWAPGMQFTRLPATAEELVLAADPASDWARLDPEVLRDSMSCGSARCHPDITAEWGGSPHRFSGSNAFYRAAVDQLIDEGRMDRATFCANCHDPERVATGTIAEAYRDGVPEGGSDGVSCIVCHGMVRVDQDPPANGLFTLALAPPHTRDLRRFEEDVLLDARRHDEVLGVDSFVLSPQPCKVCHRVELGPTADGKLLVLQNQALDSEEPGADTITCEECHLPRLDRPFDQYTHRMAGINVDQAAYSPMASTRDRVLVAGHTDEARLQAGLTEVGPIDAADWPRTVRVSPDYPAAQMRPRILGLQLNFRRGESDPSVEVVTRNLRVGHDFPSGPFDLQDVWLEWMLRDAEGRVLRHEGRLSEAGVIEGEPPRLGARELTADGSPLPRHRLFELARVEGKRVIPLGGRVVDHLRFEPEEAWVWPLELRARWLFRRAGPDFAAFALGEGAQLPAHELVAARISIAKTP